MYVKDWLPEEGKFVICTIKNLEQHRARVSLDEYEHLEGMVHSSEISRKWVRNLKTYMKPGKKLVCKVMDVDSNTRHINLSVRRVGFSQTRTKQAEYKNEKTADDLLNAVAKQAKIDYKVVFEKIGKPILKKYGLIYPFLQESVVNPGILNEVKLDSKIKTVFVKVINNRIKAPTSQINGTLKLYSEKSDGLTAIKLAVKKARGVAKKNDASLSITYAGAPKYNLKFESQDLKGGEKVLGKIIDAMEKEITANEGSVNFTRN